MAWYLDNTSSTIPRWTSTPTQTVVPCLTWWSNNTSSAVTTTATTTSLIGTSTTYVSGWVWSSHGDDQVIYHPYRPAIHRVTEQELLEQDQASYRIALSEHNEQEAQRLLRQIAERERVATERRVAQAAAQAQQREEAQRWAAAKECANEFLLSHLNPSQRETYKKLGWFVVQGGKTKTNYRIRAVESMMANVDVIVSDKLTHRLCAHVPKHKVPLGDQLLAQKMMLEFSEDEFLRIANRH